MPQAIERLLATPMIRPRLPRMRPDASTMPLPAGATAAPRTSYDIAVFALQAAEKTRWHRLLLRCGEYWMRAWCFALWHGRKRIFRMESDLSGFHQGVEECVPALRRYARALTRN